MIFIIIPVHNRRLFTYNCLKSLFKQKFKDFKVIVVDDGSTDGTSQMIQKEYPEVTVLKGDGNLWWAGATNLGVEYVLKENQINEEDYILTLNNDLETSENYLQTLVIYAAQYKNAILGSVSVDIFNTDKIDFCGVAWNEFTAKYRVKAGDYHFSYRTLTDRQQIIETDLLLGRGTLVPIKVFKEIGVYDSVNFPHYAADDDFTLRARRHGWRLIIPVRAVVKSYITETGVNTENVTLNPKYFKHLFFSIKSPMNFKTRYRWAMKHTKLKIFYFLLDFGRISFSFLYKALRKSLSRHRLGNGSMRSS